MIVSHRYRLIFIKTHKTAGSSIETALGPLCGPDDIVTPMELSRPEPYARNYFGGSLIDRAYGRHPLLRKIVRRDSPLLKGWFWEHMPAARVRALVPADVWNGYHKVCVERNPWDKVVSYYLWKVHGQRRDLPGFREYVLGMSRRLPTDGDLYLDRDGRLLVDEVIQFPGLVAGFQGLVERLGIPFQGELPREKAEARPNRRPYPDYYDAETRARVAELFSREIALFDYRFGD